MNPLCSAFVAFLSLMLADGARSAPIQTWITPDTGVGRGVTLQQALDKPFLDVFMVTLMDHRTVTVRNCNDYLKLGSRIGDTLSASDFNALQAQGGLCRTLQLASTSRPAARSYLSGFSLGKARPAMLPPEMELAISDEEVARVAKLSKAGASLAKADPDTRPTGGDRDTLKLRGSGWDGTYAIYLRGYDLNGDGVEDILVEAVEGVTTGGTLTNRELLYITRTTPNGPLRAFKP